MSLWSPGRTTVVAPPAPPQGAGGLPGAWRAVAEIFRDHGEAPVAIAYERCAQELEMALREACDTPVTLAEASFMGGYSQDHLGRLIREGKLENAGRPGAPRIRREDVPIKAQRTVAPPPPSGEIERTQIVRSAITGGT